MSCRPARSAPRCCCWPAWPTCPTRSSGLWPTSSARIRLRRWHRRGPGGFGIGPLPLFPDARCAAHGAAGPRTGEPGPVSLALLAIPYLAGVFGGLLTVRTAPSPTIEAAPLWGLAAGAVAGCVTGALAVFSGGPLGTGRLAAIGPSGWQVALVATLEIGIAAAITAGIANWLLIRRRRARGRAVSGEAPQPATEPAGHRITSTPGRTTRMGSGRLTGRPTRPRRGPFLSNLRPEAAIGHGDRSAECGPNRQ